jgi:5-methylcytosine-specific restriction endonuclease McrA
VKASVPVPTYKEMLRDPRWQKKRLQIMERDGFACRKCSATTKTLNVHHGLYYGYGQPPWEYPAATLFTLCEDCHVEEEAHKKHLDEMLPLFVRQAGGLNTDVGRLCTLFCDLGEEPGGLALIFVALDELWHEQREIRKRP